MANELTGDDGQSRELGAMPGERMIEAGYAMQRVQSRYATAIAVQRPRELKTVTDSALLEADLLGESAYFRWGKGKDEVCGPSIKLANVLVRCWGNCAIEMAPVQETPDAYIFTAAFIDLETGFTLTRQFRQSKNWTVYGKLDEARKEDIRFQIGQSKASRNVALNALPSWLIDRAMKKAMEGVKGRVESFIEANGAVEARRKYMDRLISLGAKEEAVLRTYRRETIEGLSLEDLVAMSGDIRAITEGEELANTLYPPPDKAAKDAPKALGDLVPEGAVDPKVQQQVKSLNELEQLRKTITDGFNKLSTEKQQSFLKSCGLDNIVLVNVETDMKTLSSFKDILISEQ